MTIRKTTFANDTYYHVFNRGVEKRTIFQDKDDVDYFLHRLVDFNNDNPVGGYRMQKYGKYQQPHLKLVKIVAYCLIPNHFHLILKQEQDDGISRFMQRIGTGYVKFFNKKYDRNGTLFQGRFKANHITDSLSFVGVYVNLNYRHHHIDPNSVLVASSYDEYLAQSERTICDKDELTHIMDEFSNIDSYKKYALDQSNYFKQRKQDLKDEFE